MRSLPTAVRGARVTDADRSASSGDGVPPGPNLDQVRAISEFLTDSSFRLTSPRWVPTPAQAAALRPIRLPTAVGEVSDRLLIAIALDDFPPGSRLPPERDMALMLEVGRSTVREALRRLEALEFLEIRRGRSGGAYVREWRHGELLAAIEAGASERADDAGRRHAAVAKIVALAG
jgi:DNA-binding GntR family transcriptional regulator